MAASNDFQKVRDAVDIVSIIGEYLRLKPAGKEYKCLCPFHEDHRPSMAVVPAKQIFHCFVCGTGGDVIKFVMNYHKMTAGEALRFLAQKGGVTLSEFQGRRSAGNDQEEKSVREVIMETNDRACGFFEKTLQAEGGKAGLDYLRRRGLTEETIKHFRLGYSPEGWTGLVTAAGRVGISSEHLDLAGLVKKRSDGTMYDVFRGRVMFPIFDAMGRVIAFGGRVLEEKRDEAGNVVEAKYLNSPETRVFTKSESLYGINFAKRSIIESQTVIVVEGYMDVIACHQVGVTNVVATLGTALTPEHAKMLRRLCHTVVLVFDSDDAGYRAADRAMETFVREPLDVKIASVSDGKDPCDFCLTHGAEAFKKVVVGAKDAIAYQWQRLQAQFRGTDSLSARQKATEQFMRFVAQAMQTADGTNMDAIRKGLLISQLSNLLGLPPAEVSAMLKRFGELGPATRAPATAVIPPSVIPAMEPLTGMALAEGWVLGALLSQPGLYGKIRDEMKADLFQKFRPLAIRVIEYLENAAEIDHCSLAEFCSALNESAQAEEKHLLGQAIYLQAQVESGGKAEENLIDGWKWLWNLEIEAAMEDAGGIMSEGKMQQSLAAVQANEQSGRVRRFVPKAN